MKTTTNNNSKTKFYLLIIFLVLAAAANAQQLPARSAAKPPVSVKDTIYQGVKFPLYVGAKGGKFIIVTSKTGTLYKKYFKK